MFSDWCPPCETLRVSDDDNRRVRWAPDDLHNLHLTRWESQRYQGSILPQQLPSHLTPKKAFVCSGLHFIKHNFALSFKLLDQHSSCISTQIFIRKSKIRYLLQQAKADWIIKFLFILFYPFCLLIGKRWCCLLYTSDAADE